MLGDVKNLKDTQNGSSIAVKDNSLSMSYTKTVKLITALYIVTDIMDKEEPLRNKLRTLGTGIISDINLLRTSRIVNNSSSLQVKIEEILSFLDIASAIGLISSMNNNILKKELLELKQSVTNNSENTLTELFNQEELERTRSPFLKDGFQSIGHGGTRIGVQKGSTLLKALSDKTAILSNRKYSSNKQGGVNFNLLKEQRREDILKIIKDTSKNNIEVSITDIKNLATGVLASAGEKTIQRELVSMVKDNLLSKTGKKRWSKYSIASTN